MRCDVHILTLEHERKDWLQECMDSLKEEPVTVHVLPGIINGQGEARANGFRAGSAEFVSYVDPDDTVVPGAFEMCFEVLDRKPELTGVWTAERTNFIRIPGKIIDDTDYVVQPWPRYAFDIHHLVVMRRTAVEPYLDELATWTGGCEKGLWMRMVDDGNHFEFINRVGYNWRQHSDSARFWRTVCPVVQRIGREHFKRTRWQGTSE